MKIACRGLILLGYRLVNVRIRKRNPFNLDLVRYPQQNLKFRMLSAVADGRISNTDSCRQSETNTPGPTPIRQTNQLYFDGLISI